MSNTVLNRTFKKSQQKNAYRLALIALADRANDAGLCDPGFADIAERCHVTERQAKRLIAGLEESGEVYIGHGGGRKSTNLYFITVGLSLEQITATLEKHFNLGERTAETARAIYGKVESAGLYAPGYVEKGVTRGVNSVPDDTLSHSKKDDIQDTVDDLNGVIRDTVYTKDDQKGDIQGQETVSSIPPEPLLKPQTPNKNLESITDVEGVELKINFELTPHLHGTLKDKWVFYRDDSGKLVPAVVTGVSEQQLVVNAQGIGIKRVGNPAKRVYYQNGGPGLSPVEVGGYEPKVKGEPMTDGQKAIFETYLQIMPKANFVKIPRWKEAEWIKELTESAKGADGAGYKPEDFTAFEDWYKTVRWGDSDSPAPISLSIIRNNWNAFLAWRKDNGKSTDDLRGNTSRERTPSSQTAAYCAANDAAFDAALARKRR